MTMATMAAKTRNTHANDAHEGHHDTGANAVFGFWLYLMSDLILFGGLFITYVVLHTHTVDGPGTHDIFNLKFVFTETMLLLVSSCTFGFAMFALVQKRLAQVKLWMVVTFILGLAFVCMEVYEFHHLISENYGPGRSAFLSAFFTLVGTHGIHVTVGLIWIIVMMVQICMWGINQRTTVRLTCLSLFWHFLDIVWICVFSVVYLFGMLPPV